MENITVNLDENCVECGEKGATPSGLCMKCVTKKIVGGIHTGVIIKLPVADKLILKAQDGKTVVQFETRITPGDFARLLNLQRQGMPITAVFESPQAALDLKFEELNLNTGEVGT